MNWISPIELHQLIQKENNYLILDVREAYEQQICRIPCLHIPMAEVKERKAEIPTDKIIVVMCRSGKRAEAVANFMQCELGFSDLLIMEGGILNWIEQVDSQLESY